MTKSPKFGYMFQKNYWKFVKYQNDHQALKRGENRQKCEAVIISTRKIRSSMRIMLTTLLFLEIPKNFGMNFSNCSFANVNSKCFHILFITKVEFSLKNNL